MTRQILNGWKEISNHIERGVRTAQRWEALGMPIHRPALKDRSAVVAFSDELDAWLSRGAPDAQVTRGAAGSHSGLSQVHDALDTLAGHTAELASQTQVLQKQLRQSREMRKHRAEAKARAGGAIPSRLTGSVVTFRPVRNSDRPLPIR